MAGDTAKGISFTLTLAAIVMTFSSSGITDFFGTVGDQQESNVEDYQIQQACSDLASEIESDYCEQYMPVVYDGPDQVDSSGDPTTCGHDGVLCAPDAYENNNMGEYGDGSDYWPVGESNCASTPDDTRSSRSLPDEDITNESGTVYIKTGSQLNCNWRSGGYNPNVEVEGQTFNCIGENYIQSDICPVQ